MRRWLALVPMVVFLTFILLWLLAKVLRPIAEEIYSAYKSLASTSRAPSSSDHLNYGIPKQEGRR
jgi:hypothetical protein